jgi:hypothetical protein
VEKAADFSGLVILEPDLLETADANHLREKFDLPLAGERLVDRRAGEIRFGGTGAGHDGDEKK